jgi:hypothetical protein
VTIRIGAANHKVFWRVKRARVMIRSAGIRTSVASG